MDVLYDMLPLIQMVAAVITTTAAVVTARAAVRALNRWRLEKKYDIYIDSLSKLHGFCQLSVKYSLAIKTCIREHRQYQELREKLLKIQDEMHVAKSQAGFYTVQVMIKELDSKDTKYVNLKRIYGQMDDLYSHLQIDSLNLLTTIANGASSSVIVDKIKEVDVAAANIIQYAINVMTSFK